jgi:hypothetical protein
MNLAEKDKILNDIKKGIKESQWMQSGKLKSPNFNIVLQELRTEIKDGTHLPASETFKIL